MAKKETTKLTVVKDEEKLDDVSAENAKKPTPEEIEQYKTEFQEALKIFTEERWAISDKGNFAANDVGLFIEDFMKRFAFWSKNGWMGMIKMAEVLRTAMLAANEETALELDYQALEFCAYMMSNPGGIGLDLAFEFEKIADKFSKIGVVIGEKLEDAREKLKNVQYLQERWAAAEQGFYLADLEKTAPEKEDEPISAGGNTVEIDLTKE